MNNLAHSAAPKQSLPPDHKALPPLQHGQVRFEDCCNASDDLPHRLERPMVSPGDPTSPLAAGKAARLAWVGTIEDKRRVDPREPTERPSTKH